VGLDPCTFTVALEPLAITKREAFRSVGSPKIVQRWLFHEWVITVRRGGRGRTTLIDYQSFKAAYGRLLNGEEPPLLPCEERQKRIPKAEVNRFLAA
jgi:hypothetical protein